MDRIPRKPRLSILVAEDTSVQRLALGRMVRKLGHDCLLAHDGHEGLEICQIAVPDVIICDLEMPRMNGLEMCKQVRAIPSKSYPYFIFCRPTTILILWWRGCMPGLMTISESRSSLNNWKPASSRPNE